MSFIDIKDPKKRDAIVADYLATVKRIQQRNLNEKAQDLARNEELKEMFDPVVQSTARSTEAITKELIPIRDEVKNLNENLLHQAAHPPRKRKLDTVVDINLVEQYHRLHDETKLDQYFGIQRTGVNRYTMGDKDVIVDQNSNIFVGGIKYEATPGLWSLIMMKTPPLKSYTQGDLLNYRRLIYQTNVMTYPQNVIEGQSRPRTTYKWRKILAPLQQQQQEFGIPEAVEADDEHEDTSSGDGIVQFLPGDIKGLTTKLNLLLAEFAAGNRSSTRNEIVYILDELLRRKKISRKEYSDINSYLAQCL